MWDLRCGGVRPTKSGGRQPAVGVETRLRRHKRPCSADRRRCMFGSPLHSRYIGTTGGLHPPLLCWCTDVCERQNDFCDVRTPIRKSAARQPAVRVGNTFAQTQAHLFGRPPTVYVRIAVALALYRYHGGLTPPRSCVGVRTSASEKTIFAMCELPFVRAAGVSPPWFGNALATAFC
jgi:hypothetical protein